MDALHRQIADLEHWLREHPHACLEARHDMIARLHELNEQLTPTPLKGALKQQENGNSNNEH